MTKLSIITINLNNREGLQKTMASVLCQTFTDYEYIIIDGGSTDGSVDLIKKFADKITYWVSEPDKGIYDAMNKGLDAASGEWINFMNAGDVFYDSKVLKNFIEQGVSNFPEKIFFYSDYYSEEISGERKYCETDHLKGLILHQSAIYKKNLHKKHGYYIVTDKIIVSDYIFFVSINTENTQKLGFPISIILAGGVSSGIWCGRQKLCIDYVFHKITLSSLVWSLCYPILSSKIKNILGKRLVKFILLLKNLIKKVTNRKIPDRLTIDRNMN